MGPIKINTAVIAEEGQNVSGVKVKDKVMGDVSVDVMLHEKGGRAWITVKSIYTSETRMPRSGDSIEIDGVLVSHERE